MQTPCGCEVGGRAVDVAESGPGCCTGDVHLGETRIEFDGSIVVVDRALAISGAVPRVPALEPHVSIRSLQRYGARVVFEGGVVLAQLSVQERPPPASADVVWLAREVLIPLAELCAHRRRELRGSPFAVAGGGTLIAALGEACGILLRLLWRARQRTEETRSRQREKTSHPSRRENPCHMLPRRLRYDLWRAYTTDNQ